MILDVVDEFYKRLGRALRAARKAAGLTQDAVGHALGLSRTAVANVEAGRHHLAVHQLVAYADVVGALPAELLAAAMTERVSPTLARRAKAQEWPEEVREVMETAWRRAGMGAVAK